MARLLVLSLRALLLALTLAVGTFIVGAASRADQDRADSSCCSDCPIENSGHECPPECPDCHCHHTGGLAIRPSARPGDPPSPRTGDRSAPTRRPQQTEHPREPFQASIYRPPRPVELS